MLFLVAKTFLDDYFFKFFLIFSLKRSILNPNLTSIVRKNKEITTIDNKSKIGIQIGDVTHHQDQSMFPVNLRTKNTTNNTPVNPIPDEDELFDAIITNLYLIYLKCCFYFVFLLKI